MSQEIGRLKKSRRGKETQVWLVNGADRICTFIKFGVIWVQFVVPLNNYNSNMKDNRIYWKTF